MNFFDVNFGATLKQQLHHFDIRAWDSDDEGSAIRAVQGVYLGSVTQQHLHNVSVASRRRDVQGRTLTAQKKAIVR